MLEKAAELLTANLPDLISLEVQQTGRAIREMKAQVPSLGKRYLQQRRHVGKALKQGQ